MPATALLVAEPELAVRGELQRRLSHAGFQVHGAPALREALELAERTRPDLVLLGAGLSDGTALELCARLREGEPGSTWDRRVPVVAIGRAGTGAEERVRALERGVDDVVPRPVAYEELVARIRAVLRRAAPEAADRLEVGELVIDRATRRLEVGGRPVRMSAREFDLLFRLATDPERVFTKTELLRELWGFRTPTRTRTLDTHASRVRCRLRAASDEPYVVNVWGVGYRLRE